jgi:hypothetical protein
MTNTLAYYTYFKITISESVTALGPARKHYLQGKDQYSWPPH